jgi:1,4-dihydroxy-2-naphthoate octaprenyltransferase
MAIARHGQGPRPVVDALLSQVHPVFMLPPVAASWFGSILAGRFSMVVGGVHMLAIFFAVYTAHVKDGYIDFHHRAEDADHPLTVEGCRLALLGSSFAFFAIMAVLWMLVDWVAVALTVPGWLIGYNHAPRLDQHPIGATMGYPTGIALAIIGGFYVQTGVLSPVAIAFGLVFLVLLSGVKVIDDAQDERYDRSIDKRTVAVSLGIGPARRLSVGLMALALIGVVGFAAVGTFPVETALAVPVFGVVAGLAHRADPEIATMLLIRGSYLFLAVLIGAVWFRPLG